MISINEPVIQALDVEVKKATELVRLIQRHRFDLSNEKSLQVQLAEAMTANNVEFEREKPLSPRDIPDFMVAGGIAIECKMRGARKMDVFKQLRRYAEHDEVKVLVLATNLSMGLPAEIGGKPSFFASLSRGWL
jgi:LEA14-like dessication related protein